MVALAKAVMKLRGSINCGELLGKLRNYQFLKNDSAPWRYSLIQSASKNIYTQITPSTRTLLEEPRTAELAKIFNACYRTLPSIPALQQLACAPCSKSDAPNPQSDTPLFVEGQLKRITPPPPPFTRTLSLAVATFQELLLKFFYAFITLTRHISRMKLLQNFRSHLCILSERGCMSSRCAVYLPTVSKVFNRKR